MKSETCPPSIFSEIWRDPEEEEEGEERTSSQVPISLVLDRFTDWLVFTPEVGCQAVSSA